MTMRRMICRVLLLCSLTIVACSCGNKNAKENGEPEIKETVEDTVEESTEETTVKTMQAEDSVSITIGEDSEGALTPDD